LRGKAVSGLAALSLLPGLSVAQGIYANPAWYGTFFGGKSTPILGSQDIRTNYGVGLAWQRPEPHFKWRHGPAQLVMEGYFEHSNGEDHGIRGKVTESIGVIWYARFRFPQFNLFADIGEGVHLSTSESFDLGTRINSSPMLGFGFVIRQGNQETMIGARLLHISNAGLNQSNRGQNQVLFYMSVKL
jgi:hypothetical protein